MLAHQLIGAVALALKRLAERGLVSCQRDKTDARRTLIALTEAGRAYDRPALGTVERAVQRALRATPPRDVETVRAFLQRLVLLLEVGDSPRARRREK